MDASAESHLDYASGNLIVGGSIPSSLFSLDKGLRREIVLCGDLRFSYVYD